MEKFTLPERCFEQARERAKSIQRASPDALNLAQRLAYCG